MSRVEIKEFLTIIGLMITIGGGLLGAGVWIGAYVKDIEKNSAKACEFVLLHEMARKRAGGNNKFGNYIQNNLNVLSAQLNLKDGNTEENWEAVITREKEQSEINKLEAEKLYKDAEELGGDLARCRSGLSKADSE